MFLNVHTADTRKTMTSSRLWFCRGRREDSSDSEHGGRHSRHTRTTHAVVPAPSSSSSRDRRHAVTPRQRLDHTRSSTVVTTASSSCARQTAVVSGRRPQCIRDDSIDSFRSSVSAGTGSAARCTVSHTSVAPPYLHAVHHLHRFGPPSGGLTLRLTPETCV